MASTASKGDEILSTIGKAVSLQYNPKEVKWARKQNFPTAMSLSESVMTLHHPVNDRGTVFVFTLIAFCLKALSYSGLVQYNVAFTIWRTLLCAPFSVTESNTNWNIMPPARSFSPFPCFHCTDRRVFAPFFPSLSILFHSLSLCLCILSRSVILSKVCLGPRQGARSGSHGGSHTRWK